MVAGSSIVRDSAVVQGRAFIKGSCVIGGSVVVKDDAKILGAVKVIGDLSIGGKVVIRDQIKSSVTSYGHTLALMPWDDGTWRVSDNNVLMTLEQAWAKLRNAPQPKDDINTEFEDVLLMFEFHVERLNAKMEMRLPQP